MRPKDTIQVFFNHKYNYYLTNKRALIKSLTFHFIFSKTYFSCQSNLSRVMRKPTFWLPTRSDTNQAVQLPKMARGLKFRREKVEECTIYVTKTRALIRFAVTAEVTCVFVFAYVCFLMTRLF